MPSNKYIEELEKSRKKNKIIYKIIFVVGGHTKNNKRTTKNND